MKWVGLQCVVLLLLFAVTGIAQEGSTEDIERSPVEAYKFDFTGGGARAEGMGKAFIAVSDDITAGSWNPAGLYIQGKPVLSLSYGSLVPRGSTNSSLLLGTSEFDHTGSFNNISAVNFVAPIRIKGHHFVGSFNFTRNFDEFQGAGVSWTSWEFLYYHSITGDSVIAESNNNLTSELQGGLNSVNIGFGTRLYKNVSFGVSLNIYAGEAVRDQLTVSQLDSVVHVSYVDLITQANYTQNIIDTNKFSGYNATIGLKLKGEKLDVGLVVRTPFAMNIKTGRSYYSITYWGSQANGGTLLPVEDQCDTTYYDDLLAKYDIPLMVGAGVAYRVSKNLLLAADAEYRHFSGGKIDIRDSLRIDPGGHNKEYFTKLDPKWNNVFTVRAGGEYLYQAGIGLIPIRAGLGYVPVPSPNIDISGDTSTVVSYDFSLGTGIHWSQIHLDWAYTYSTADWKTADLSSSVEQKNRNHHFNFTFTGYF
jgi:opacity protein-like surface antigen